MTQMLFLEFEEKHMLELRRSDSHHFWLRSVPSVLFSLGMGHRDWPISKTSFKYYTLVHSPFSPSYRYLQIVSQKHLFELVNSTRFHHWFIANSFLNNLWTMDASCLQKKEMYSQPGYGYKFTKFPFYCN